MARGKQAKRKQKRSVESEEQNAVQVNGHSVIANGNADVEQLIRTSPKVQNGSLNGQLSSSSESISSSEFSEKSNKTNPPLCNTVITVGSVSPKSYDGSTNVDEYIEHFRQIAKCNNWSPKLQMSRIPIYLTGPANLWFRSFLHELESKDLYVTIDEVFEAMRKEFRPQNHRTVYQSQLSSRKQGLNEPVQQYYYDVLNLCMRVNLEMSDEEKLFHLCQGLKSTLLEKVLPFEPRTCKELLQKCKSIEEAEVMANNRPLYNYLLLNEKKPQVPDAPAIREKAEISESNELSQTLKALADSVKESNDLTKKLVETLSSRPQNNYRNQRAVMNLNGQRVCFRCNNPGHTSRYCYLNAYDNQNAQAVNQAVSSSVPVQSVPRAYVQDTNQNQMQTVPQNYIQASSQPLIASMPQNYVQNNTQMPIKAGAQTNVSQDRGCHEVAHQTPSQMGNA